MKTSKTPRKSMRSLGDPSKVVGARPKRGRRKLRSTGDATKVAGSRSR